MSQDIAISVRGLSKSYTIAHDQEKNPTLVGTLADRLKNPFKRSKKETFWALKDVSFDIKKGDVVGIIGRNGAGKSTLLKILSRITEPTAGEVDIYGRVGSLLEVGTGFSGELSGRENIYLNGAILGMSKAEIRKQFDAIVDFSGVEQFIDTPVKRYSSGMYVRLAFAVAAHLASEVLIIDEVLAVGDAEFQKKCLGKMGEVAKAGRTILFVSHNLTSVQNLCRTGVLLSHGRLTAMGSVAPVVRQYTQASEFSGTSMDLKDAKRTGKGEVRFTRISLEDEAGEPVQEPQCGKALVIALRYKSSRGGILRGCVASVMFTDTLSNLLFNCSCELTNPELDSLPPEGVIRCRIPRLPLSKNQYVLSPFIMVEGEVQDWLEGAIAVDTIDGDFYGSGRLYHEGWQGKGVLVPHDWSITPALNGR